MFQPEVTFSVYRFRELDRTCSGTREWRTGGISAYVEQMLTDFAGLLNCALGGHGVIDFADSAQQSSIKAKIAAFEDEGLVAHYQP